MTSLEAAVGHAEEFDMQKNGGLTIKLGSYTWLYTMLARSIESVHDLRSHTVSFVVIWALDYLKLTD